jgi:hypothetical protein
MVCPKSDRDFQDFFGLQHLLKTHQIQIVNVGKTENHLLQIFQAGLRNLT